MMDEPMEQIEITGPAKKKRGGQASIRTEKLGNDPRLNRSIIRESLTPGYFVCLSGKRKIRTLHKLGLCYALPDVDYLQYEFAGSSLPPISTYDSVCNLCAGPSSKLAHLWQRALPTCGREKPTQRFRQSDIQFGTREQSQQHWYGMRRRFLVLRGQVPSE